MMLGFGGLQLGLIAAAAAVGGVVPRGLRGPEG